MQVLNNWIDQISEGANDDEFNKSPRYINISYIITFVETEDKLYSIFVWSIEPLKEFSCLFPILCV